MKRISLLLTCLFLFCNWIGAQNEKISFNKTEHDFGVIGEKDGNVSCDFIMTNHSKEPVVISRVTSSCGCTTPTWTKEPIGPGKTGTINIGYIPLGRVGTIARTVSVYIDQMSPISLKISGSVVRGTMKIVPEEVYPQALGNYLLKSKDLDFGQIGLNETRTIRWEVYNNSDAPITQKILKLPKYISVNFQPAIIPPKTGAIIDLSLNVQEENLFGNISGDIALQINEGRHNFPFKATILDDFSQWTALKKENAGKINVSMSEINFGNFSSGNSRTLKISNSGKSLLNIRAIQSSDPSITVSKTKFSIKPGEIAEIKIIADNKKIQSELTTILSIFTDDPKTPIYNISVIANKKV